MLYSIDDANALIASGVPLHIAGDEKALMHLARGTWIGGTIPYFLTAQGGRVERDKVFINRLPVDRGSVELDFIAANRLDDVPAAAPGHGFSLIVVPAGSDAHARYAVGAQDLPGIFNSPVVGWVAGVHLDDIGRIQPKAFNGQTGEAADDCIAVLRAHLPSHQTARVGIINLFQQGEGDRLRFPETGFTADQCWINGEAGSFYDYVKTRAVDPRLPLVANLSGEMINVSFQAIDEASHSVRFYAPVLSGIEYRQAAPVADYRSSLLARATATPVNPAFACNCILNYLYADLAGDKGLSITGPATFGEIAYLLLNQTLVYLELTG